MAVNRRFCVSCGKAPKEVGSLSRRGRCEHCTRLALKAGARRANKIIAARKAAESQGAETRLEVGA